MGSRYMLHFLETEQINIKFSLHDASLALNKPSYFFTEERLNRWRQRARWGHKNSSCMPGDETASSGEMSLTPKSCEVSWVCAQTSEPIWSSFPIWPILSGIEVKKRLSGNNLKHLETRKTRINNLNWYSFQNRVLMTPKQENFSQKPQYFLLPVWSRISQITISRLASVFRLSVTLHCLNILRSPWEKSIHFEGYR